MNYPPVHYDLVRFILYARVSSVRQEQDGKLARQTKRLKEAASERGYGVVQVITEQASSLTVRRKRMKSASGPVSVALVDWRGPPQDGQPMQAGHSV